ncbi:hypothetical protein ABW20_dc0107893 [Dactylellina cionopaga]|nr:hypothetical protein ABW20_dc0107893 [Dactylellina cionopaga]
MNPLPPTAVTWTALDPTHNYTVPYPLDPNPPLTQDDGEMRVCDMNVSHGVTATGMPQLLHSATAINNSHTHGQVVLGVCNCNIINSRLDQSINNGQQWNVARALLGLTVAQYNASTTEDERTQFVADEMAAGRSHENINDISQDPVAARNWKYWVILNVDTLPRHLFGHAQDALVPAFWTTAAGFPFRQRMALLLIDLGCRFVAVANTKKTLNELTRDVLRNNLLKNQCYQLDYYTRGLPHNWVSDLFPFTIPKVRRDKPFLYNFTRFIIQNIPQVADPLNPGVMMDDIPHTCVYP